MVAAFYILLLAGHLGFFDVLNFHTFRCRLRQRPECHSATGSLAPPVTHHPS
jgi:hypothetical protein